MKAALPSNEAQRLKTLRDYDVLDTLPEQAFDDLTLLAAQICQTPVALISLVDEKRQWFKSRIGLSATETSRDIAFCAHAILYADELMEVRDAQLDSRFADNPLVTDDPLIRFYAGAPLVAPDGSALGTLCVIDYEPRELSAAQKQTMQALSRQVVMLFELRRSFREIKKFEEALSESESRFHDLVENANDLIQITRMDGHILYGNRLWRKTLGYSEAEIAGLMLQDIIHPSSWDHCIAQFQQVIAGKTLKHVDAVFQTRDGQEIMVEGSSSCRLIDGKPFSTRSVFRDVTERKRTEARLHEIMEKQRAILDYAGHAIISTTPDGIMTSFNPAAERMLGYAAAEIIGLQTPVIIHDPVEVAARAEQFSNELGVTIAPGFEVFVAKARRNLPNEYEWTYIRKDGTRFPVLLTVTALRDKAGEIAGFLGLAIDISERKRAQLELEQFKFALDQTVDCIFMCRADDFRFVYVNEGAKQLVGYTEAELYAMTVPDIKPEYTTEKYRQLVQPLLDGAQPSLTLETLHRHKDGHDIPVEVTLQAVRQVSHAPRLVAVIRDITERKRTDKLLRTKNEELKGFAYTVSHDLKAPLRGISGYAQELERRHKEGLTERAQFCITQIITASHNLDTLIEDLLKYSRLDAETPALTWVDLPGLISSILRDSSHTLTEQGTEVSMNVPPLTLHIWERGLHQVLTNLIDNAVKYSRNAQPPRLTVSAEATSGGCRITVTDNGIGFDMKYHDRIFGLFNRLVRADEFEGTGAGLAIVKKLMEKLGGSIRAESAPDQGATFIVELPASPTTGSMS